MTLSKKEIEVIYKVLTYVEGKAKDKEVKEVCSSLIEKIDLKFYFSPEEDGKLRGLNNEAKKLYYVFYEKYDLDLMDYLFRIKTLEDTPKTLYKKLVVSFPPCRFLAIDFHQELMNIIRILF